MKTKNETKRKRRSNSVRVLPSDAVNGSAALAWTKQKPNAPGWYWCQNYGDIPGERWEAVVRVERLENGLNCCWLTSPQSVGVLHKNHWSEETLWAGPIPPPNAEVSDGGPLTHEST